MFEVDEMLEKKLSELDAQEFERMYSLLHAIRGTKDQLDLLEQALAIRNNKLTG